MQEILELYKIFKYNFPIILHSLMRKSLIALIPSNESVYFM